MKDYNKPLPKPTPQSQVFWDGCKREKLFIQQCKECGKNIFYPKLYCPFCLSKELSWIQATGKGRIYTYMIVYGYQPTEFEADLPYVVAVIDLEEGVKIMSNIVDSELENIRCDASVEVVFDKVTDDVTLPRFRLAKS